MRKSHWLVSGAVAVVCGAVLVLFTDIEVKLVEWVNCGPLSVQRERDSQMCR